MFTGYKASLLSRVRFRFSPGAPDFEPDLEGDYELLPHILHLVLDDRRGFLEAGLPDLEQELVVDFENHPTLAVPEPRIATDSSLDVDHGGLQNIRSRALTGCVHRLARGHRLLVRSQALEHGFALGFLGRSEFPEITFPAPESLHVAVLFHVTDHSLLPFLHAAQALLEGLRLLLCSGQIALQLPCQPLRAHAIQDSVRQSLSLCSHIAVHLVLLHVQPLCSDLFEEVLAALYCFGQHLIFGKVCHQAQLQLGVVCTKDHVLLQGLEGLPDIDVEPH
mmetsp:Transcript_7114/g.20752  ORF Transcript_7114/g.20752 Transcript_7114/m.20752 type:complete len:278 (+) Transcript_7114:904-1737(+)